MVMYVPWNVARTSREHTEASNHVVGVVELRFVIERSVATPGYGEQKVEQSM